MSPFCRRTRGASPGLRRGGSRPGAARGSCASTCRGCDGCRAAARETEPSSLRGACRCRRGRARGGRRGSSPAFAAGIDWREAERRIAPARPPPGRRVASAAAVALLVGVPPAFDVSRAVRPPGPSASEIAAPPRRARPARGGAGGFAVVSDGRPARGGGRPLGRDGLRLDPARHPRGSRASSGTWDRIGLDYLRRRRAPARGLAPIGRGFSSRVRKRILPAAVGALALFCVAAPAGGRRTDASVRVFVLKWKRVEEAALLIRPHLSESASVTLTQRLNAMTVTDREENLKTIARDLAEFDVPPRGLHLRGQARAGPRRRAGRVDRRGDRRARSEAEVHVPVQRLRADRLRGSPRRGGQPLAYRLGGEYILTFTIGPAASERRAAALALSARPLEERPEPGRRLGRSTAPRSRSSSNQTLVVGASREEGSKNALILILLAQEVPLGRSDPGRGTRRWRRSR